MGMTNVKREPEVQEQDDPGRKQAYLEALTYVERLHRRLLDVIKDELDRIDCTEINS
ncbi:MAG: MarR family transcriptional regulator, partial [Alphaproteobacteria bacterium]|nr:MarR family transcriptional regulator [Alphaproteobacteria bacterium]MDX5416663.1 MarR family transcriptional regulator [Alphaproteobacteria bacterium]MDX5494040.1 MarR family transcriptional regulator [Alphaproteobacteria bacterium]